MPPSQRCGSTRPLLPGFGHGALIAAALVIRVAAQEPLKPAWLNVSVPCLNFQPKVLRDKATGWPAQCMGLTYQDSIVTADACATSCSMDANCSVWQWWAKESSPSCYTGYGEQCEDRGGSPSSDIVAGQRIQHGEVVVEEKLKKIEILGLLNVGLFSASNETDSLERCRDICYSDTLCRYWTWGTDGCWVERPRLGYSAYGSSSDSEYAQSMIGGQRVRHECHVPEHTAPSNWFTADQPWPWLMAAGLFALVCICPIMFACGPGRPRRKKRRRSRGIELNGDVENGNGALVYAVPAPVVTSTYALLPQPANVTVRPPVQLRTSSPATTVRPSSAPMVVPRF